MLRYSSHVAAVGLAAVLSAGALPSGAAAQVTTDRGASIVVFPKVVADAATDTVIQLANLSDNRVDVYCAYLDGSGTWQTLDFRLGLGPHRPLHWSAAAGRSETVGDEPVDIPAAPAGFRGELLCVQTDVSGSPFNGDQLAGQATLADLDSGDAAAYRGIGLRGGEFFNDNDQFLCLGGEPSENCLIGAEYDACPAEWLLSLPAEGATDAQLGVGSRLSTTFAVAPCSQNLRDATPGSVDIDLTVFNELGQRFTGQVSVTCWADLSLAELGGQIFTRAMLGSDAAEARLAPSSGSGGFVLIAQTTRSSGDATLVASSVALNAHHRGATGASDVIVLP